MYYENKRSFYIRQYGPVVLVIVIALVFIVSGIVIGFNYSNKNNVVADNRPQEELPIVDSDKYTYSEKSISGVVTSVTNNSITIKVNEDLHTVNLIGVMQNSKNPDLNRTMENDLTGKTVTVDYDNVKTENGKVYGYVYVNGALYNETLLAKGLAELRPERDNIDKLDVLVAAQIKARHNGLGIWELK